uniref:ribosomal protein L6 n=1 Tax=Campylaephora boydenii TaxID=202204 RepID=UPI002551D16D|nr:ribosomal protein L6 [Campylaephora boydenii]WGT74122.1 ribosomal protein L6 [Campylaephora boydenii]
MSRIGKKIIVLPPETNAKIENAFIIISGPKGELKQQISPQIEVNLNNDKKTIHIKKLNHTKKAQALHGLYRSIINNMVTGVSKGFEKKLIINGVGYRSQNEGNNLILNVGYSHPISIKPPDGINIKVEKNINITVSGINKETVGQIAAKIRATRPPEPYKGKGIKYFNETIRRKVGKAGK